MAAIADATRRGGGGQSKGRDSLDELVGLLVRSVVAEFDDPDGGTEYLLIVAELVTSRGLPITSIPIANYHTLANAGFKIPRDEFIDDLIRSLVAVIGAERRISVS